MKTENICSTYNDSNILLSIVTVVWNFLFADRATHTWL